MIKYIKVKLIKSLNLERAFLTSFHNLQVNVSKSPSRFQRLKKQAIAAEIKREDFVANLSANARSFLFPAKPNRHHRVEVAAKTSRGLNWVTPTGSCNAPAAGRGIVITRPRGYVTKSMPENSLPSRGFLDDCKKNRFF